MALKRGEQCIGQYAICLPGRQAQQSWHVLLELNAHAIHAGAVGAAGPLAPSMSAGAIPGIGDESPRAGAGGEHFPSSAESAFRRQKASTQ